ncbi:MAG TPA: sulfite oxidase [Thermoanaerobaculia bacterium]|nr:sulfite oxidase [Thermoanaerobaculia bacterium]
MRDGLKDERTYELERAEERLWREARALGVSRRRFLQLAGAGAGLATFSGFWGAPRAWANHTPVVKPTPSNLFFIRGTNREMKWEAMKDQGYKTGIDRFFVRNHTATPHIDVSTWRLRIEGTGVAAPVELTYDDILAMPAVSETKFIECAGNGRSFFASVLGQPASGTQWLLGAIGVAEWTGVRLSTVLAAAGLKSTAVDVMPTGLDTMAVRRPMPIEKALDDDTLLVYGMNGEVLPVDHGFPVRVLTPGWIGIANIKWVGRIEVSETPLFSDWNTTTYRYFGPAYPDQPVLFAQEVKSALELPFPATVPAGPQTLTGRSWSGHGSIDQVEVSFDGGGSWTLAALAAKNIPFAWRQWSVAWDPTPGSYAVRVRATDSKGNTQPDVVPFNSQGYLYWAAVNHPVTVF